MVIEGNGQSLLGRHTALKLNVLIVGPQSNQINSVESKSILEEFPEVTKGFGKLNDFELKTSVGRDVPYHLRDKLSKTLDELDLLDIIERVNSPSKWMSSVVKLQRNTSVCDMG